MIIDVCCYNGEKELFEIRYNILKDFVDEFIVVEFDKTFSGKLKPNLFLQDFLPIPDRVKYFVFKEEHYEKYRELAENSSSTVGAGHWKQEFIQKESIKDVLLHLKDNDIVFVGDVDEIWNPEVKWQNFTGSPFKLKLDVYTYYLNNHSSEQFYGTLCSKYFWIKNECLNHLRTNAWKTNFIAGWHFTSMHHQLAKKLTDSYTEEDYAHPRVLNDLEDNIENNRDFLGRNFTYKVDESQWPDYLKKNREKYLHLLK